MQTARLSRLGNIVKLYLCFGAAAALALASACLVAAAAGWLRPEDPASKYPDSVAVGAPKVIVPHVQLSGCPSWGLTVDSRYATSDRPDEVMSWYWEDRPSDANPQSSAGRLVTSYQWGPLGFDILRLPSLSRFENVTQISMSTNMQVKLCL